MIIDIQKLQGEHIYDDKVQTNVSSLNVPEDGLECDSLTIISVDSLLVYENKYYLQIYVDIVLIKL